MLTGLELTGLELTGLELTGLELTGLELGARRRVDGALRAAGTTGMSCGLPRGRRHSFWCWPCGTA